MPFISVMFSSHRIANRSYDISFAVHNSKGRIAFWAQPIVWQLLARCGECVRSRWIVVRARPRPSYPFLFFSPPFNRLPHRSDETGYLFHFESSHLCTYTAAYPHYIHGIRHFRVCCLSYTYYHFRPLLSRGWWKIAIRGPLNGGPK